MEDYMIQILILMAMANLMDMKSAVMDDVIFGDGADSEENYEMEDELEEAGLDSLELECMDEEERREAIEDAGFDPDDYNFD